MKLVIAGLLAFLLVGCTTKPIEVSTTPVEKAPLILPAVENYYGRNVEWHIITPENAQKKFAELEKAGKNLALFAVTDDGYEALALNLKDLQKIILQYQAVVAAYKEYYTPEEVDAMEEVGLIGSRDELIAREDGLYEFRIEPTEQWGFDSRPDGKPVFDFAF